VQRSEFGLSTAKTKQNKAKLSYKVINVHLYINNSLVLLDFSWLFAIPNKIKVLL
jgi:hypothetical protein